MPEFTKIVKGDRAYQAKDSTKRPLSVVRLQFHPHAPYLLAQVVDSSLFVWRLDAQPAETNPRAAGPLVSGDKCCGHAQGWIRGFDVARSGDWLATGGSDRRLKLWRWTEGKPEAQAAADVPAHDGWVEAVAFSPDGKLIATGGSDRCVKLWDAADLKPVRTLTGHTGFVRDLCWAGNGQVVSGAEDGKVIVWDVLAGKSLRSIHAADPSEQQGQTPEVGGVHRVALSRDGCWLAAAGSRRVALFDLGTGSLVAVDAAHLQAAFHPAADILAVGDVTVRVGQYLPAKFAPAASNQAGKPTRTEAIAARELGSVKLSDFALGMSFAPDGQRLALGNSSGLVEIWQLA